MHWASVVRDTHHESRKFVTFFEPNESCDENGKNISILVNTYYQILKFGYSEKATKFEKILKFDAAQ